LGRTFDTPDAEAVHPEGAGRISKTIGYFGAFVALGMAVAALGPTLPGLAEHTRTQLSAVSYLFTARSLGYLLGALLGGRLYDRLRGHLVMGAALALMVVALMSVPLLPALWLLVVALLVLGLAEGTVEVGSNTLLLWVHRDNAGPFVNGLHFFFGVGAFLAPVLVALAVVLTGSSLWAYWFLAVLIVPVSLWVLRQPSPARQIPAQDGSGRQVNGRLVALVAAFFLLYAGVEGSFAGWIPTYAQVLDLANAATAAYLASAFWGSITVGRLLATVVAARIRPSGVITAGFVGGLSSLGLLLAWPRSMGVLWVATLGLGLSLAPMVPTTLALIERRMAITGRATGWFFVGLGLGGMTVPWLIGQLFERIGPDVMIWTITADLILALCLFALVLAYSSRLVPSNS
jgi:fucose permease